MGRICLISLFLHGFSLGRLRFHYQHNPYFRGFPHDNREVDHKNLCRILCFLHSGHSHGNADSLCRFPGDPQFRTHGFSRRFHLFAGFFFRKKRFISKKVYYFMEWIKKFIGKAGFRLLTRVIILGVLLVLVIGFLFLTFTVFHIKNHIIKVF